MNIYRLKQAVHYNPETGIFTRLATGKVVGTSNGRGHLQIEIDGRKYYAHRLAWLYVHGTFPVEQVDHINGIRDDNRIANLREATVSQTQANSKTRRAGLKGASYHKRLNKWHAQIMYKNKRMSLGYFKTEQEAHEAYKRAALTLNEEFAQWKRNR